MKRQSYSSFRNSDMDRAKPKKRIFRTLINSKLKRHRSDTGLVEDRTNSVTVVRLIIGLLLIHLIVIGGVILRGKIKSGEAAAIAAPTITAPPTPVAAAQPVQNDVLPQPVEGPVANPTRPATEAPGSHITQPPTTPADPAAPAPAVATAEPELVTPPVVAAEPAPTAPEAPAEPIAQTFEKHLVASGETLFGIAAKYSVSVEAIRQANPQVRNNNIISGTYLKIPVKPDSDAGRQIAAQQAAAAADEAAKTYVVKRGDTLGRIARRNRTTVAKLMQLNNIPKGKEGSIRIGDKIRIAD